MSLLRNSGILRNKAFRQTLKLERRAPGQRDPLTGKFVPGAIENLQEGGVLPTIYASVQPTTTQELKDLREMVEGGARIRQAIRIYTAEDLRPGFLGEEDQRGGDVVEFEGLRWSVVSTVPFQPHGHSKVYGVRIDGQDG